MGDIMARSKEFKGMVMNRPAYYELPISGSISINNGEIIEYRAESTRLEDGIQIIEGAWTRDKSNTMYPWMIEFTGPFTLRCYPKPRTRWQKLRSWIRKTWKWMGVKVWR